MQSTYKLSWRQKVVGSFFALMLMASAFAALMPTADVTIDAIAGNHDEFGGG